MLHAYRRLAAGSCLVALLIIMAGVTTPVSAQFGGLKKRLKEKAASEGVEAVAPSAPSASAPGTSEPTAAAGAPAAGGPDAGMIVLTPDVVDRLVAGLQAGEAERAKALQEDTPYGRYHKAQAAYAIAEPKCAQAQQTFPQRLAGNEKLMNRYDAMVKKMVDAQTRGDNAATVIYSDSANGMMDPSCTVKRPQQPSDYYDVQREIDNRVETAAMTRSGFSRSQLGQVRERAEAILRGATPPGDASKAEQDALAAHGAELKPLLGIHAEQPAVRTVKSAPTPAPAQPSAPARVADQPAAPENGQALQACMTQNVQSHETEIKALGARAEAARQAGNTAGLMAIADTLQRIQMAGCMGGR